MEQPNASACWVVPAKQPVPPGSVGEMLAALLAVVLIGLLPLGKSMAEAIPALSVIQPEIAAAHPNLVQQRETLLNERKVLYERTNSHNQSCSAVEAGSAADASCTQALSTLNTAINSHVRASRQYNASLLAAVNLAARQKPAPLTDASVVDARNVPSGLPKSVDDAIPHTPSGDRVRKGFEAIQAGDWKAALAWFQDARNKEPGNPGLGRLVDLAQFTLDYRAQAKPPTNSAPAQTTQLPKQNSTINSTGAAPVKSGDPAVEPGDNSVARAAAGQMAARARADAAFKQYVEKYGDHYSDARTRAVSKAYRGEGYTDEELKAQLQKSLLEYRTNYRKNHPNGPDESVGGSPAVEEILIGGRG